MTQHSLVKSATYVRWCWTSGPQRYQSCLRRCARSWQRSTRLQVKLKLRQALQHQLQCWLLYQAASSGTLIPYLRSTPTATVSLAKNDSTNISAPGFWRRSGAVNNVVEPTVIFIIVSSAIEIKPTVRKLAMNVTRKRKKALYSGAKPQRGEPSQLLRSCCYTLNL